jgi:uncharacterized SAM-binding protein YcdF (DUF218 family)
LPLDAIIVPGGGVRPEGQLPPWVEARCRRAMERAGATTPIILLSAATLHRPPPLDENGFPWLECNAGARFLLALGFPAERLWTESSSYDTIGNAYFCRTIHTDPRSLRELLIVNSEFHMPRTRAIFDWVFGLPGNTLEPYRVSYEETPNEGLSEEAVAGRVKKEEAGIESVRRLKAEITTLAQLHQFLYSRHDAYRAGGVLRVPRVLSDAEMLSY